MVFLSAPQAFCLSPSPAVRMFPAAFPSRSPPPIGNSARQLAVPHHPRDAQIVQHNRWVLTDEPGAEPVEMTNRLSATAAWAVLSRQHALARLLEPSPSPQPLGGGGQEPGRGDLFTLTGDGQGCQARVETNGLALAGSSGRSTSTTTLASRDQSLLRVTLPGAVGNGRLQVTGMDPTLVSLSVLAATREALRVKGMLCLLPRS